MAIADWNNDDLVLYHGCTDQSLYPAAQNGIQLKSPHHQIDLSLSAKRPDFGTGFYATTWFDQAVYWANRRCRQLTQPTKGKTPTAVVLKFAVSRDALAGLEQLTFLHDQNSGYWPFINHCRTGNPPHGRSHKKSRYDIVLGPVSSWPMLKTYNAMDQVSFHTSGALRIITSVEVCAIGGPLFEY